MIFEGPFIICAVLAMTVFHPGRVFGDLWIPAGKGILSEKKLGESDSMMELTTGEEWNNGAHVAYRRV